ncbi:unnamed protein product [Paramecium sonneborni]|uniref:OTU domain-containing protein n=1 Tax=Paramecium sonneborni TaxID=65129 RepID=A0A8S1P5R1_9CILI|nr:unnamed protein product [Paramecium sonneborni]
MLNLLFYGLGIIIIILLGFSLCKHYLNQKKKEFEQNNKSYNDQVLEEESDNCQPNEIKSFQIQTFQKAFNQNIYQFKKNTSQISQKSQQSSKIFQNSSILSIKNIPLFSADDKRTEQVQQIINYLYDKSCRKRNIEEKFKYFLGHFIDFQNLCKEYNIKKLEIKQKLKQLCSSYLNVRGDGNCFYTAFGYQFLEILLFKYKNDEFQNFIKTILFEIKLPFQINLIDQTNINQNQDEQLRKEFIFRLEKLKSIQNVDTRRKMLYNAYKAHEKEDEEYDGCFYGLSTIFFRNISIHALDQNELKNMVTDRENLLIWETECNNNEIVIQSLSNFLKLYIQLIFFTNESFQMREYGTTNVHKIILLIRPGHYNIGIAPE